MQTDIRIPAENDAGFTSRTPYASQHIRSIATGRTARDGIFAYSPVFLTSGGNCTAAAPINMTGRRRSDRAAFIRANPGNYDDCQFHHTYSYANGTPPTCDAQMVDSAAHAATCPHTGAVKQYQEVHGGYTAASYAQDGGDDGGAVDGEAETVFVDEAKRATDETIKLFEFNYMLEIPAWLVDVFKGKSGLPVNYKTSEGYIETVCAVVPLALDDYKAFTAEFILDLAATKAIFERLFPEKAVIPYATDPCGNIFACVDGKTYFYDHEQDEAFAAAALGV